MKICSKCGTPKAETEFNFRSRALGILQEECKSCHNERARAWRVKFPELAKSRDHARKEKRKLRYPYISGSRREYDLKRYQEDPEGFRERSRMYRQRRKQTNPGAFREAQRARRRLQSVTDPAFRVTCALRTRLHGALKASGVKKSQSTFALLGCPRVWLEVHLESLFKPGMTWGNYGPVWHIDHVKPCAVFDLTDLEQQRICFHWTNLQPLFAKENLQKADSYLLTK